MNFRNRLAYCRVIVIGTFLLFIFIFQGCNEALWEDAHLESRSTELVSQFKEFKYIDHTYTINSDEIIWKEQLNKIIENNDLFELSGLMLLGYKYIKKIDSEIELDKTKSEIVSCDNFFPLYEKGTGKFSVHERQMPHDDYLNFLNCLLPDSDI